MELSIFNIKGEETGKKVQLSDEKLAGVDGGRIPPLPEIPTTTTL